jgi:hypothetical protein
MKNQQKFDQKGIIIDYVLIFGAIFLMLLSGLLSFIIMQLRSADSKVGWNESLNIAEGGMNYFRWCLNNNVDGSCLGQHEYYDADGNDVGKFSITSIATTYCGVPAQQKITVSGWTNQFPASKRNVVATYARPSVAQYSYILNSNVWAGNSYIIRGPYHSNGGIRIDGTNQSLVTSAATNNGLAEWVCNDSFGCNPCPTAAGQCRISGGQCLCPGVFTTTANANPSLFQYPVTPYDFNGLTVGLASIKDKAQHAGGIYLPKSNTLNANGKGYHLKFQAGGTVQVWVVTGTSATYACDNDCTQQSDYQNDYYTISSEYLYNTYTIPVNCSAIFAEDNIWPEGVIKGKVAVASANLVDTNVDTDAILNNNITYAGSTGADGLSLIAERNVLIGPASADVLELHGIFTAQNGHFGRNYYGSNTKTSLAIYGSIISNGRVGTQWTSNGQFVSGYSQRETYYDQAQVNSPPPFIGRTSQDYKIVSWQEIN